MKKEEAIVLVMLQYPEHRVGKVRETAKYFLVNVVSKHIPQSVAALGVYDDDGLVAVDKQTKEVFTYNPIRDGE